MKIKICFALCVCAAFLLPAISFADEPSGHTGGASVKNSGSGQPLETKGNGIEQAQGEQLATAIGHFGRARALIIAAIQEFDTGCKFANPKVLINVEAWRSTLLDRVEDLERVLAPQPRVTKGGVQYEPNNRLLHGAK